MPSFEENWASHTVGTDGGATIAAGDAVRVSTTSPSHGPRGLEMDWAGPGTGATRVMWQQAEAGRYVLSTYFKTSAITQFEDLMGIRHVSGTMVVLGAGADGKLVLTAANGAGLSASRAPQALPPNTWIRLELAVRKGTTATDGYAAYAYYEGNDTEPIYSYENSAMNTGTANVAWPYIGRSTGRAQARKIFFGATVGKSLASGWIGPYEMPAITAEVDLQPAGKRSEPMEAVTLSASIINGVEERDVTYQFQQSAGPSVQLSGTGNERTYVTPLVMVDTQLKFTVYATNPHGTTQAQVTTVAMGSTEGVVKNGQLRPAYLRRIM